MAKNLVAVDDPFDGTEEGEGYVARDTSPTEIDRATYGGIDIPESGRVVAKPIALELIHPDMVQPRRAIPLKYRKDWFGNPEAVPDILNDWQRDFVETFLPKKGLAFPRLINGTRSLEEELHGIVVPDEWADLFDLVGLAASIYAEGLTNPIAVTAPVGATNMHVLIAGERRYLACHMIWMHRKVIAVPRWLKGGKMPARIMERDVWAQASENGARKPLNAIGMARQLALLIMAMYEGENTGFKPISYFFNNGGVEKDFYAQVANGQAWRIKKGLGQRILDVTGLKTKQAIGDYRQILTIPNDVWQQADAENWALGRIQKHMGWKYQEQDRSYMYDLSNPNDSYDMSEVSTPATMLPASVKREDNALSTNGDDAYPPARFALGAMVFFNGVIWKIIGASWAGEGWMYKIKHPTGMFENAPEGAILIAPQSDGSHIQVPDTFRHNERHTLPPNPIKNPSPQTVATPQPVLSSPPVDMGELTPAELPAVMPQLPISPTPYLDRETATFVQFLHSRVSDNDVSSGVYKQWLWTFLTATSEEIVANGYSETEHWAGLLWNMIAEDMKKRGEAIYEALYKMVNHSKGRQDG